MRGLEPFSAAKGIWGIIRELSLDEIREEALIPPSVLILSDHRDIAERIAANVTGVEFSGYVTIRRLDEGHLPVDGFDAVIIYDPDASKESKALLDRIRSSDGKIAAAPYLSSDPSDQQALRARPGKAHKWESRPLGCPGAIPSGVSRGCRQTGQR